jgi:hypothetical protein
MAAEITHNDLLNQDLNVGNYVVASRRGQYSSTMTICQITKTTPKKVFLQEVKTKREWSTWPQETVKLSGEDVLHYILKYV